MPLQATSGVATYDAFGGGAATAANYIEDVFQTWLYTGNSSTQTITNGIDLAGKGGMVWSKARSTSLSNFLCDTVRGRAFYLYSNNTFNQAGPSSAGNDITAFNNNGYSLGPNQNADINNGSATFASWTFAKQEKFFDVVTWTGNGASNRRISHNLESVPGCIIVKRTDAGGTEWYVWHRTFASSTDNFLKLNSTNALGTASGIFGSTGPTSTDFGVGSFSELNGSGGTFVAYVFAHNAGGFGLTGTDNVISCGSFTTDGSGAASVTLGYEPQFGIFKATGLAQNWVMQDIMRGATAGPGGGAYLLPNSSAAEATFSSPYGYLGPTATGFNANGLSASQTYIYIAIRRGPMKTPTSGTSVFLPATRVGNSSTNTVSGPDSNPVDTVLMTQRSAAVYPLFWDRLRGRGELTTNATSPELFPASSGEGAFWDVQQGMKFVGSSMDVDSFPNTASFNASGVNHIDYKFRRAPGFFDEVCYTGTGGSLTVNHNLGVAPELIITKSRSASQAWTVQKGGDVYYGVLNTTAAFDYAGDLFTPTATQLSIAATGLVNTSGTTYVAYLFASCLGVSKVGTYTGTGTTQVINCGFTAGSRFVMIKRTDSTGDWYVWDSARGIVAGNDPYLLLNSTAAEVTSTDYVDTAATGFELSSTAPAALNASGGSYIFLAIA